MVRAESGSLFERFRKESIVAAGSATPNIDLSGASNEVELRRKLEAATGGRGFLRGRRFEDVRRFVLDISNGDVVVTPSAGTTELLVRNISGGYRYVPDDPDGLHLHRPVAPGRRVALPRGARNALPRRPAGTLFALSADQIALIRGLLSRPFANV